MRASSSSHSAVSSVFITSVRSWSLSVSLSKWKEFCWFHVLKSRLQTEYMFLAIDTKRKTRWTYVISLNSSSVSLLIAAFRTSASVIRLRRLYDLEHPVVHRISPVLQLCPERGVSLPVLLTEVHVRRADYLNPEPCVSTFRRIQYSRYANMILDQCDFCQRWILVSSSHLPTHRCPWDEYWAPEVQQCRLKPSYSSTENDLRSALIFLSQDWDVHTSCQQHTTSHDETAQTESQD